MLPSAHEDDILFEGEPNIGSATNTLQKLVVIAEAVTFMVEWQGCGLWVLRPRVQSPLRSN
jgi:hypothetical protein